MKKVLLGLSAAGLLGWGAVSMFSNNEPTEITDYSITRSPATGDRDCSDFSTHADAQTFFNSEGAGDPHGLDRDGDGTACETLP